MRRLLTLVAGLALAACGDNLGTVRDAGPADGGTDHDAAELDAGAPPELAPCLDRPDDLPRPPSGQLPCDLLPPGFGS